jgi:hypothetical protein
MQFGRAPVLGGTQISDLRFERGADNFTALAVAEGARGCPPHLTSWAPPRADLLAPPPGAGAGRALDTSRR